jgi:hypothetical protein
MAASMSWHSSRGRWSRRLWVELLLLAILALLVTQQAHSEDSSTLPAPLWDALLQSTMSLPDLIDAYNLDWTRQVQSLQASNERLQTSNASLTRQNAGLQTSLTASQADLATSEGERLRLQNLLNDSSQSITQAQGAAQAVIRERDLWRIGAVGAGIVAVVLGIVAALK